MLNRRGNSGYLLDDLGVGIVVCRDVVSVLLCRLVSGQKCGVASPSLRPYQNNPFCSATVSPG
jgi:hypothetical protein